MRQFVILLISVALLALEYYLGTRKSPLLGALLPGGMVLLVAGVSLALRDFSALPAAAAAAAWLIGRSKAKAAEKAELEKMKAKDL